MDVIQLRIGGTCSPCVWRRLSHHMYQAETAISSRLWIVSKSGIKVEGDFSKTSNTSEPDRSLVIASVTRASSPSAFQIQYAPGHLNNICNISSASSLHSRQTSSVPMCLLKSMAFNGITPCNILQQKIFTLAGTFRFHKIFHVGLLREVPLIKDLHVRPLNWCLHST
jgi:hypothetical protein